MQLLIAGLFVFLVIGGLTWWVIGAIQSKQTEGVPAPTRRESEYGGHTRTVRSTPRQRETAAKVKVSERTIATARRQSLKGLPKGTVHCEPIKPVSYEGKTVNGMCLGSDGSVLGYVDLAVMPLDWE